MKRLTHSGLLLAVGILAALLLCACSAPGGQGGSDNAPSVSDDAGQNQSETQTIQGTLNQIDTDQMYLVLVTDEAYYRFDFSESGEDLSALEPGDNITITYTGTLDDTDEDVTAKLVSVVKN